MLSLVDQLAVASVLHLGAGDRILGDPEAVALQRDLHLRRRKEVVRHVDPEGRAAVSSVGETEVAVGEEVNDVVPDVGLLLRHVDGEADSMDIALHADRDGRVDELDLRHLPAPHPHWRDLFTSVVTPLSRVSFANWP